MWIDLKFVQHPLLYLFRMVIHLHYLLVVNVNETSDSETLPYSLLAAKQEM